MTDNSETLHWAYNANNMEEKLFLAAARIEKLEKYANLHAKCEQTSLELEQKLVNRLKDAHKRIEHLEAALRTIDNAIPKNNSNLPVICLVAGDIAEGALNGTWPAFGVMPRAALKGKKDVD